MTLYITQSRTKYSRNINCHKNAFLSDNLKILDVVSKAYIRKLFIADIVVNTMFKISIIWSNMMFSLELMSVNSRSFDK